MNEEDRTFTLAELGTLVEMSRRTIRYYIQIELLDRPAGAGRGAHYTQQHLKQLLEIRKWQKAGLSLDRIRELLSPEYETALTPPPRPRQSGSVEVWSHVVIDEGIELVLDPMRLDLTPEEVRRFASAVMEHYQKIRSEKEER